MSRIRQQCSFQISSEYFLFMTASAEIFKVMSVHLLLCYPTRVGMNLGFIYCFPVVMSVTRMMVPIAHL